ncbi:hypothetical protein [Aquimarina latercula]|uniref:hypothetical protein n=1 Tax=Aquimarina latercula TaxID=987 RepID=UPI000410989F|nr:hypothetical protein [Aquimarina latercula]
MKHLYKNMECRIQIGSVAFDRVHSVVIDSTIKKISDTAVITLPRAFPRTQINGKRTSIKERNITDYIKVGDPVVIRLGYDQNLQEEFRGYVDKIGADHPLRISCMDAMYLLKKQSFSVAFESINLKSLLQYIAPEYEHNIIDTIDLGKFTIDNKTAFQVLEQLRKDYGLHSFFKEDVLHVAFPISMTPKVTHSFVMNKNVRAVSNSLEFVKKDDVKLLLKAISINDDGKRIFQEFGDKGGVQRTLHFANRTKEELKKLAQKNYQSLSFDGYQGTLPGWGEPRTKSGDALQVTDPAYSERNGTYLIEGVTIKFNSSDGFLRENKLGLTL